MSAAFIISFDLKVFSIILSVCKFFNFTLLNPSPFPGFTNSFSIISKGSLNNIILMLFFN